MSAGHQMRPSVVRSRQLLAEGREKVRAQHERGTLGIQVCAHLTDLFDTVVLDVFEAALEDLDPDVAQQLRAGISLVPHGGYGRRDASPFSDVDLMLLYTKQVAKLVQPLARRLQMDLTDAGLALGFNPRTPSQAVSLAISDPVIFTSLAESRFLAGSVTVYSKFVDAFRSESNRRCKSLVDAIRLARRAEREKYGNTVYMLEPNVKRSRGALRDYQLLRWVGFARYGESEPQALRRSGNLSEVDLRNLRNALAFLLRMRNDLHFNSGKAKDVLERVEQLRLAEKYGYQGSEGLLPVEEFMRDYFVHTRNIRNITSHFVAGARQYNSLVGFLAPVFAKTIDGDFRVGPVHISTTKKGLEKVRGDLVETLRLMELANLYNRRIEHRTWEIIRTTMMASEEMEVTDEAKQRFMALLTRPGRLGSLVLRLHELRVLERFVPGFDHARGLLQFNDYHKYTVDVHSLKAVDFVTTFQNRKDNLGSVYRSIKRKETLHLALLVHDLGKGFPEDHSEVGLRLAAETAEHLGLAERMTERVKFLVHKHLMMAHLAFRRDTSDQSVVVKFAVEVGSPEVLKMLYVLTCADMASVSPDLLNDWKLNVLTELYHSAMTYLAGDGSAISANNVEQSRRKRVAEMIDQNGDSEWYEQQVEALPPAYLAATPPETIAEELERLRKVTSEEPKAWSRYLEDRQVLEISVGAYPPTELGTFHRLTGALTSQGLQILSAQINTLAGGLVLDRFLVTDMDHQGTPPAARVETILEKLVGTVRGDANEPPTFRTLWKDRGGESNYSQLPTQIQFDNDTSENFTVLDIFAHDRMGLLYTITRTLSEMGISIAVAKIGTYLDQVVDVFYITGPDGKKVEDEQQLARIRDRLLADIEE